MINLKQTSARPSWPSRAYSWLRKNEEGLVHLFWGLFIVAGEIVLLLVFEVVPF